MCVSISITVALLLLLAGCAAVSPSDGMVVRIRLEDGSMEKHLIPTGDENIMTLGDLLGNCDRSPDASIKLGSTTVDDDSKSLNDLDIKHGSIIAIVAKTAPPKAKRKQSADTDKATVFHAFPDLAKDYESALRQKARRRGTKSSMSYADMANLQSALHLIEPQPEGPLKRIYMCHASAQRFQSNCIVQRKGSKPAIQNRAALLLGSIHRERVDTRPRKVKTSLSTNPSANDFCQVAKVHALWEPSSQKGAQKSYDTNVLQNRNDPNFCRMLKVASYLDLQPVGWIFSYNDNRLDDGDALPVWGSDIVCGASLQIEEMKNRGRTDGGKFVTLAMDANGGATEAFQLSDVSVQMVSEGIVGNEKARFVSTTQPVLVDSKETQQLDSVLCLVNTAMLSHKGAYSGQTTNVAKKTGSLTAKTKKSLLKVMDDDQSLLDILSDFNILLALDAHLAPSDSEQLCRIVQKWSRGLKRGTKVPSQLKSSLRSLISTT